MTKTEEKKKYIIQTDIFDLESKKALSDIFNNLNKQDKIEESPEEKSKSFDEISRKWQMNDKVVKLFCDSVDSDIKLKNKYAKILVMMLAFQLIALNIIFVAKGFNWLQYSDVAFNVFITGSLGEIFGLVVIIVKYLFKDNLSESLHIILKSSNFIKKNSTGKANTNNNHK